MPEKTPAVALPSAMPVRPFHYMDCTDDSVIEDKRLRLAIDGFALLELATEYGTPLYLYSAEQIRYRLSLFQRAFSAEEHTVCYAVKANSALALLRFLGEQGAGFDIVSGGELERVRRAYAPALKRVVFSGVGKQAWEIDAALEADVLLFNVESPDEIELLADRAAALGKQARFALRVNPDVFAETHPYISTGLREHKFGISMELARELYRSAARHPSLLATGVSVHIGSQIRSVSPFAEALKRVAVLIKELRADGHTITHIDAGGGLGVDYHAAVPDYLYPTAVGFPGAHDTSTADVNGPESQTGGEAQESLQEELSPEAQVAAYAQALLPILRDLEADNLPSSHLLLEPGRFLVAQAGGLLTRVLTVKRNGAKQFVVTDAGMNDLIRPALYEAHHEILPVTLVAPEPGKAGTGMQVVDVVGPVCESGDFFARDRALPPLRPGDLALLLDAGAYGMSQSSNYNTRPRPAEILVRDGRPQVIRRRENLDDLFAPEQLF